MTFLIRHTHIGSNTAQRDHYGNKSGEADWIECGGIIVIGADTTIVSHARDYIQWHASTSATGRGLI